jgi:hypothetical protein
MSADERGYGMGCGLMSADERGFWDFLTADVGG